MELQNDADFVKCSEAFLQVHLCLLQASQVTQVRILAGYREDKLTLDSTACASCIWPLPGRSGEPDAGTAHGRCGAEPREINLSLSQPPMPHRSKKFHLTHKLAPVALAQHKCFSGLAHINLGHVRRLSFNGPAQAEGGSREVDAPSLGFAWLRFAQKQKLSQAAAATGIVL